LLVSILKVAETSSGRASPAVAGEFALDGHRNRGSMVSPFNMTFPFGEIDYYLFGVGAGIRNLFGNSFSIGLRKTVGKILQPITSYTRFPEYYCMDRAICEYLGESRRSKPARILDIGSPKCFGLYLANKLEVEVEMTDVSRLNLDEYSLMSKSLESKAKGRVRFSTQDARALDYEDATFDIVYSMSVIEHIEGEQGDSQSIREMVRVLKPGGLLLLSVPFGKKYVEQQRAGLAHCVEKTEDQSLYFFQRIYDRAALESRVLSALGGLQVRSQWTIWRERDLPVRALKQLGENIQGLLGFLNPLLSRWCNRCASGVVEEIPSCYGEIYSTADSYGDFVFVGEKSSHREDQLHTTATDVSMVLAS
jgi:SAM-dependent methyltransferase